MKSIEATPWGPFHGIKHLWEQFQAIATPTGAKPPTTSDGIGFLRGGWKDWFAGASGGAENIKHVMAWHFNGEMVARFIEKAVADNFGYTPQAVKQIEDAIAAENAWYQASPY